MKVSGRLPLWMIMFLVILFCFTSTTLGCWHSPKEMAITPVKGDNNATLILKIVSQNFTNTVDVKLVNMSGDEIAAQDVKVSKNEVSCTFDLAGKKAGQWDLQVTNYHKFLFFTIKKTATLKDGFTIEYPAPSIGGIEPRESSNNSSVNFKLTGAYFRPGAMVELESDGGKIIGKNVNVIDAGTISCEMDLLSANPGTYHVRVTNEDGKTQTLTSGFKVLGEIKPVDEPEKETTSVITAPPTISGLSPGEAMNDGTKTLTVQGTGFLTNLKVWVKHEYVEITGTEVVVNSSGEFSCQVDLKDQIPGVYDLVVENPDEQTAVFEKALVIIAPAPVIKSVSPDRIFNNAETALIIEGMNFYDGLTTKLTGQGEEISGNYTFVDSVTMVTSTFVLTGKPLGSYDLTVTNRDGQKSTLVNALMVLKPVAAIQPNQWVGSIYFQFDRAAITEEQLDTLEEQVALLQQLKDSYIIIGGHACEVGTKEYNYDLSVERTDAVKSFLIEQGIDPDRIITYAYGEKYPIREGEDEDARSYNRRVDILLWDNMMSQSQLITETIKKLGPDAT